MKNNRFPTWLSFTRLLPWLILAVSFFITHLLWKDARQVSIQKLQIYFDSHVHDITGRIEHQMKTYEQVMRGAQGLYNASESVKRAGFRDYIATQSLTDNFPGIQGIGFNLLVSPANRNRHIAAMKKDGFPEYTIRPPGERDFYTAIIFLEPTNVMNLRAIGFDTFSEPVRRVAMKLARDSGKAAITGKIKLVQETSKDVQAGVLMFLPVYKQGTSNIEIPERRSNIIGWISAPFRMNDLMSGMLGEYKIKSTLTIDIFDGAYISPENLLFNNNASVKANTQFVSQYNAHRQIEVAGRIWSVVVRSLPNFEEPLNNGKEDTIAFFGIVISILMAMLSHSLLTTRDKALGMAHDMTKDLHEQAVQLELEVADRQRAQEELAVKQLQLQALNESLESKVASEVSRNREKDHLLLHRDKLASIGQLAAGVAHEINNPMGFIMSNLGTLTKYVDKLQEYLQALENATSDELRVHAAELRAKLDVPFILEDLPPLIAESLEGADRVKQIVLDLKDFARTDENSLKEIDLNHCIESTANIVRNEIRYVADLNLQLGSIPPVVCNPQQINQVIANLLVNAAHAMDKHGRITVTTSCEEDHVLLTVADTGSGIAPELIGRIFDPFFTTKDVGKGTGLGLSISYDIISKHGGKITVKSELGAGSTFMLLLPVRGPKEIVDIHKME